MMYQYHIFGLEKSTFEYGEEIVDNSLLASSRDIYPGAPEPAQFGCSYGLLVLSFGSLFRHPSGILRIISRSPSQ